MNGAAYRGKRTLDIALVLASAPITVPVIAITAMAVAAIDGRPVFFKQERAGLNGEPFHVLKFRTMAETTNIDLSGLSSSDKITKSDTARVTKFGKLLRRLSIDELPQLWNVTCGSMSLVGPRPLYIRYNEFYDEREKKRLGVIPGITGLSQIEHRNHGGWRERLEKDVVYVETASLRLDLKLIAQTLLKALRSEGVSVIAGETGDALDDERSFPSESGMFMRRIYARDLQTRVNWLNRPDVRAHMTLDGEITIESTLHWYKAIRLNPLRRDYVFESRSGELLAMTGVKSRTPGTPAEFYLFVNPDMQSRGHGKLATRLTLQECRREGEYRTVWLSVAKANPHAVRIYRAMGFDVTDQTADRFHMEIDLSRSSQEPEERVG